MSAFIRLVDGASFSIIIVAPKLSKAFCKILNLKIYLFFK